MKWMNSLGVVQIVCLTVLSGQAIRIVETGKEPIRGRSHTEVVDEVWRMATQGKLLTADGWREACGFFTEPTQFAGNKVVRVMSNDWGPAYQLTSKDDSADVAVGYIDLGEIDSALSYKPAPKAESIKQGYLYHLVAVPAYTLMYGPDGKTLIEKKPVGYRVWQIQGQPGPPWTTVNSAIRYVLEMRDKTTDPAHRKNADETLAALLKLH
jgi:hypothetical protein